MTRRYFPSAYLDNAYATYMRNLSIAHRVFNWVRSCRIYRWCARITRSAR